MSAKRYQRLQEIFLHACGLPAGQRAAFLEEACRDEPDLRPEVETLLAHDEAPVAVVEGAAGGGGAALLARAISGDDAPPVELPARIGGYAVVRVIGEGGMGIVYEAEQEEPRRRVALKVIRPGMVTPGLLRRFRHEAQVLGQLEHPGIARIYEAGTEDRGEGGQAFFAMELIDGRPLLEEASARNLGTRDRLELIARVCDALHHAHHKGVIHRDLKPANILIDRTGQPKVLDFGVARATDADLQTVTLRTDIGQIIGTVPYMSPEQAGGQADAIDPRSDVYALGVIMFELLTGRLPYAVQGRLVHEAVRVIREEEPSRLSSVNRTFRGDVETIVAKALEKDKARRYQSAAELAEDIRRYLADQPIVARPVSSLYQLRKFARRNRALVGGVAAVLVVSILGAAVAARYAVLANRNAEALAVREKAARWQSYKASLVAASSALQDDDVATAREHLGAAPAEHRGWVWEYLHARLSAHTRQWPVPGGRVVSAPAFTADGSRMFSFMEDATIGEWDVRAGAFVRTIAVEGAAAGRGLLSAASNRYAVAAREGGIIIGDLYTGAVVTALAGDQAGAFPVAWDAPGTRLLFSAGNTLWVWDGGPARGARHIADMACNLAAFSRSGDRVLVTNTQSRSCTMLDARSGAVLARGTLPGDEANCVAFAPDDNSVAVGGKFRNIFILDAATLAVEMRIAAHRKEVDGVEFAPDGATLLSSSRDGSLRLWDAHTGALKRACETGGSARLLGAFLPGGDGLLALGEHIRQYAQDDAAARVLRGHESYVYYVAISPDSTLVASTTYADKTIRLWDADAAVEIARFESPGPGWWIYAAPMVQFSADGTRLASGNDRGGVRSVDLATGVSVIVDRAPAGMSSTTRMTWMDAIVAARGQAGGTRISRFGVYSPDGSIFATGSTAPVPFRAYRGGLDGEIAYELDHRVEAIAISPDGRLLATTGKDGVVHLHDAATGAPRGELAGHVGPTWAVAFHPNQPLIATGGEDAIIRLWDVHRCEPLLELRGHEQYVMDLQFSPDGTMLVSGSGDFTVRLWDTLPRAERARLASEARALREQQRERVETLLRDLGDPARVAERLRAVRALDDAQRRAALRVLLETAGSAGDRAAPPPHRDAG